MMDHSLTYQTLINFVHREPSSNYTDKSDIVFHGHSAVVTWSVMLSTKSEARYAAVVDSLGKNMPSRELWANSMREGYSKILVAAEDAAACEIFKRLGVSVHQLVGSATPDGIVDHMMVSMKDVVLACIKDVVTDDAEVSILLQISMEVDGYTSRSSVDLNV